MTPNIATISSEEDKMQEIDHKVDTKTKREIAWKKVIFFTYVHIEAILGLYYIFTETKWQTIVWGYLLTLISSQGIGAGAHRLWAHRTYKAKLQLRILLVFYQTMTFQKDIYDWVRDHRVHHKFSDTECDPHNASNGFFYSHIGWLMLKKEDCVIKKGKMLDLSDLEADPVIMFQRKYYWYIAPILAFVLPAALPWYFWNENFHVSWCVCSMLRFALSLHATCLVNSAAHIFGKRPYDKNILPRENMFVSFATNGEGFHNYHHAFPWDYKAAELGSYYGNLSTAFIELMARIGWAYDLKCVPAELVERKVRRSGDGSWELTNDYSWGWGDKDMEKDYVKMTRINYRKNATSG